MKHTRTLTLAAAAAVGALTLAGCGSSTGGGSASTSSGNCASGTIKASGSTAQANAMDKWKDAYQDNCADATIEYQGVGSGAGVTQFTGKQTAFAGSDSALTPDQQTQADARCATGPALNIPMVGGAIAIMYNVSGVNKLVLNPAVVAGIFNNTITKWNDPKIAALNAGVTLPDATIAQFHRSDSSGTTGNLTKYLAATAPTVWTTPPSNDWVAPGGQGSKGSDQVTASVKSTPNSIGYAELSFVTDPVKAAWIDNGSGAVEATSDNAAKTIAGATVKGSGNNLPLSIDYATKAAGAYPIVLVTYEITCQKGLSGTDLAVTKSFLTYTASDAGQALLGPAKYVPITGDLLTKVRTAVAAIS